MGQQVAQLHDRYMVMMMMMMMMMMMFGGFLQICILFILTYNLEVFRLSQQVLLR